MIAASTSPRPSYVTSWKSCTPFGRTTHTRNRAMPSPGSQRRCIPWWRSIARATSPNPAYVGSAVARKSAAQRSRLITVFPLREFRDAELSGEIGEAVDVDRSDDVDDGELARLGGDDDESHDVVAAHVGIDVHVVLGLAADGDERLPRRPELRLHAIEESAVVHPRLRELVAADVDAFELAHDVAHGALVGIVVGEESRAELQERRVECHVDDFVGLLRESGEIEIDLLRHRGNREERESESENEFTHVLRVSLFSVRSDLTHLLLRVRGLFAGDAHRAKELFLRLLAFADFVNAIAAQHRGEHHRGRRRAPPLERRTLGPPSGFGGLRARRSTDALHHTPREAGRRRATRPRPRDSRL